MSAVAEKAANETVLVTVEGYEQLRSELEALRGDGRREVRERLRKAREDGHLGDNPALYDLLVEQALLERRIARLEAHLARAQIVEPSAGVAGIGTSVRVRDLTTGEIAEYELVGQIESDVGNGRVSVTAPVGRALVGRGVGERVDVETPRRPFSLEILGVRPLAGAQRDPDRGRMKTAATPGRFESPGSRVAVLQHEPQTGLGIFSGVLDKAGVDYEVLETGGTAPLPDIAWFDGAIVLGGSLSACDPSLLGAERWIGEAVRRGTPLLGICLGGQLLARALGGFVERGSRPEVGIVDVFLTEAAKRDSVFGNLPGRFPALAWHEDAFSLPRGAVPLAGSIAYEQQAFRFGPSAYGLQFHPEVRTDDFGRWPTVPAYRDLLERAGADWGDVMYALERVRPELDALAQQLLESWLRLVTDTSAVRERRARVAV